MTQQTSSHMIDQTPGAFLHGFTLGVLAGAAGFYLFGTESGAKVRHQLTKEWEDIKKNLAEDGVIENQDISLRQMLSGFLEKFTTVTDAVVVGVERATPAAKKGTRAAAPVKAKPQKRFTGV